jgi:hypothetical protein
MVKIMALRTISQTKILKNERVVKKKNALQRLCVNARLKSQRNLVDIYTLGIKNVSNIAMLKLFQTFKRFLQTLFGCRISLGKKQERFLKRMSGKLKSNFKVNME